MTLRTPWGDAGELRGRQLRPGRGVSPEEVARNQRERLYGAAVAAVAEKGYEAMSVADLVAISGVSRASFYEHFRDKQDCFVASVEAIGAAAIRVVREAAGEAGAERPAREALGRLFEAIAAQPAAGRVALIDAYAAGPRAVAVIEQASAAFARLAGEVPGRAGMPPQLALGLVGAFRKIAQARLVEGREVELPGLAEPLWEWFCSYPPPPGRLRVRHGAGPGPPAAPEVAYDRAGRIIRAFAATIAERGWSEAHLAVVVRRASISQGTFYLHFESKEEAMLATLEASMAQLLATALPAGRRARDWQSGVRETLAAMCAFLAAEPAFARLILIEANAGGPRALGRRERVIESLVAMLEPGLERSPQANELTAEAIAAAIYAILYEQIRAGGAQSLPAAAPLGTYVALAPLIGAERAVAVANG